MNGNVPILTALIAGLISFLSPCVLPLVPPYLVFLTGASLERFENAEPERRVRRETVLAAALFVLGFSTVFVALGASASVVGALIRAYSGPLVDRRRRRHHHHGPALPRHHADRATAPAEAAGGRRAGGAVGRLCDRPRLRFRLDAVHRADPRRHPGGRGLRADGDQGRGPARRSIRLASAYRSSSPLSRSSHLRRSCRASRTTCTASSRRWERCSCSPALLSSPAASTG